MTTQTTVPVKKHHTINQLLDKMYDIDVKYLSTDLYKIRQNLIRMKNAHAKGGNIKPDNSHQIMDLINQALN